MDAFFSTTNISLCPCLHQLVPDVVVFQLWNLHLSHLLVHVTPQSPRSAVSNKGHNGNDVLSELGKGTTWHSRHIAQEWGWAQASRHLLPVAIFRTALSQQKSWSLGAISLQHMYIQSQSPASGCLTAVLWASTSVSYLACLHPATHLAIALAARNCTS